MPTSLISTGVQFPDNSIQTTAAGASGGDYVMNAYVSPTTWAKPAGLKAVRVTVVGAGGAGGAAPATNVPGGIQSVASGGGGGGAAILYLDAPAIPGPVGVTAGGGTNSFGAFCSATAGANGTGAQVSPLGGQLGALGGSGSGGTLNIPGGAGGNAFGAPGPTLLGGPGGSTILGGGGRGGFTNTPGAVLGPGSAGGNYGSGGGGSVKGAPSPGVLAGGAGAPGVVIVEEFY